jgi:TolA-binding protein
MNQDSSKEMRGVNKLLEEQLLVVSEDYVSWVNAEEKRRGPPEGKESVLSEDLLRTRRQNRAKTMRIQRLEKQLRDLSQQLEESNRRRQRLKRRIRMLEARAANAQTDPEAG